MIDQIILLISGHILGDFFLQTDKMASGKNRILILFLHSLIVSGATYLFLGNFKYWLVFGIIFSTHFIIDLLKQKIKLKSIISFAADQILHLIVILLIANLFNGYKCYWEYYLGNNYLLMVILISGVVLLTRTSSILITLIMEPFTNTLNQNTHELKGFENAGRLIGYLERILILIFVFTNYLSGIGFLIAAKSVLRFGEIKNKSDRMMAEYIIIGTFLSFGIGIVLSIGIKKVVELI